MAYDKVVDSAVLDAGLKQVADAIREKGGTSDNLAFPTGMAAAVSAIQAGGGTGGSTTVESVPAKDVNFYDYEGTRVAAYTLQEARALTALPTPPAHEGLVFEGWNWELSEINALKFPMEIGAMYYTDDDSTRYYLSIEAPDYAEISLRFGAGTTVADIDWGDGTVEHDVNPYGGIQYTHVYADVGNYIVRIVDKTKNAYTVSFANNCNNNFRRAVRAIETPYLPNRINTFINSGEDQAYRLEYVTVNSKTYEYRPPWIKCNIMPRSVTESYGRENQIGTVVSIAPTAKSFGVYGHSNTKIFRITMPEGMTSIGDRALRDIHYVPKIILPSTITEITWLGISRCKGLVYLVSLPTTPPTLTRTDSITDIPSTCKFYVPDASVDAYKVATNWSTYADRILPLSEYPHSDIII